MTNKHLKIVKEAWEDVFNSQYTSYLDFKKIQPGSSEEVLLKAKCDLFSVSKNVLVKRLNNKFDTCENMKPIKHLFVNGDHVTKLVDQDMQKATRNYEKVKRTNTKAQRVDPLSHLTYRG